ncbi:D-alanine--D-alanine ligase A [Helicobacter enhydrae]|uniref:D-alanine--D-alanine ligase n=1 Tax=Helicobacter enhydrae TaxID=222136 RepID=A0A1B1U753_9HELI|nr:D-alanine--D-alanine ligase [Helicobacter enhydrae]ANV98598.1 D-alanine--D-alanine ligase A [Helicobacter enhydrae]
MRLGLAFGGCSFEHEISIVSAISVCKILPQVEFCIFLDLEHQFYWIPKSKMSSKLFSSGEYKKCKQLVLGAMDFYVKGLMGHSKLGVECVLSLIHGGDGEDGVFSSLLDFYRIPYIAPRPDACVLSYDKALSKVYAQSRGVKVLPFEVYDRNNAPKELADYPAIIKPLRLGSSIGVGVVGSAQELDYYLDSAFEYDDRILVEPFVAGVREYNLAGFKDKNGEIVFSVIEEPQKKEFLKFEDKYLDFSRTQSVAEASVGTDLQIKLKENFAKLYHQCFEGAIIRCDFFVIDDEVYLNEINPIPGSLANYLFEDFSQVIDQIFIPNTRRIRVDYTYIHQIQRAKGKA